MKNQNTTAFRKHMALDLLVASALGLIVVVAFGFSDQTLINDLYRHIVR